MKFFTSFLITTLITALIGLLFKISLAIYLAGWDYENILACLWGIRFDLSVASMLCVPIILISYILVRFVKIKKLNYLAFGLPSIILILTQTSDTLYALNAQKHITSEASQFKEQIVNLTRVAFTDYYQFLIPLFVVLFFFLYLLTKKHITLPKPTIKNTELAFIALLAIEVLFFRSYLSSTALRPSSVFTLGDNSRVFYAMNGAYSTIYHLFKNQNVYPLYKEIPKYNNIPLRKYEPNTKSLSNNSDNLNQEVIKPTQNYNVILFLLESWPATFMSNINIDNKDITPFLNKMQQQGLSSYAMLANGKRTHEGLFATLCSANNPLGNGLHRNNLNAFSYSCLPDSLGIKSAIFQGTNADLVGDLAQQLGIQYSYDRFNAPNIKYPLSIWGIQDDDLIDFVYSKAIEEQEPFLYVINTTTTHDNVLPPGVDFKYGNNTEFEIEKSQLNHVDKLLSDFYDKVTANIKRPTIFVFMGDHTRFKRHSDLDEFSVPFIVVANDNSIEHQYLDRYTSQLDVAPTIVDLLHGYTPWFQGTSLLTQIKNYDSEPQAKSFFKDGIIEVTYKDFLIAKPIQQNTTYCFNYKQQDLEHKLTKIPCTEEFIDVFNKEMSNVYYSQDLLFNGKLKEFRKEY